jgi:Ca-activated chloride channel family protein
MLNSWNIRIWEYEFLSPQWFWLLLLIPFIYVILIRNERNKKGEWKYSGSSESQQNFTTRWILILRNSLIGLNVVVLVLLITALSKPYHWSSNDDLEENYKNGIDIVLAMDVSVSMLAMDFEPNRLEASKRVAKEFIDGRRGDRIGLVVYAGEAYTACPATLDYDILKKQIDHLGQENLEGGTAIGTGLGTAVTRLRNDSLPSKVIILLTDGSNNSGDIDPLTAAELARSKNIRVYTIGVGSNGEAPTPVITPFGIRYENMPVEIDETTLIKIAQIANGQYFRATDEKSLKSIYEEIEKLEKRKILDQQFKSESPATPSAFLNWAFILSILSWSTKTYFFKMYE